jgi:ferredoxin--NADP+ reductase
MYEIVGISEIATRIYEMTLDAPAVAKKAQAGQFVVLMVEEKGERIPMTIADWDPKRGTVTMVFMVVGTSTTKLSKFREGGHLHAFVGPLGRPSEILEHGTTVMVAGGVGTAPIYPIARSLKKRGNKIVSIQGARSKDLLFWHDKLASVSDSHIVTTDDGTFGRRGLVTDPLKELLTAEHKKNIGCVYAIGPAIMMKFCSQATEPFGVKTIVSLNSIMVDATGMCGVCRVDVGGQTKFACVDGPEFDGHKVDWELLMTRQKIYLKEEKRSMATYQNIQEAQRRD